jgi:hypothetical protein
LRQHPQGGQGKQQADFNDMKSQTTPPGEVSQSVKVLVMRICHNEIPAQPLRQESHACKRTLVEPSNHIHFSPQYATTSISGRVVAPKAIRSLEKFRVIGLVDLPRSEFSAYIILCMLWRDGMEV